EQASPGRVLPQRARRAARHDAAGGAGAARPRLHGAVVRDALLPLEPEDHPGPGRPVRAAAAVAQRSAAVGVRVVLTARAVPGAARGVDELRPEDLPAVL